jgi:putative transposase
VCADLHIRLVHSSVGIPQGRGKVERFLATLDQMLLARLRAGRGRRAALTLAQLDAAIGAFIVSDYHRRAHAETGQPPHTRWEAGGFLPRTADSLEALDLLLLQVARPRTVQRDGIRFQGLRYFDLGLAAWVGERVTIRYDPRDLAEIRVFHRERFICRAVCSELSGERVELRELVAARNARRRELQARRAERAALVERLIGVHRPPPRPAPAPVSRLKRYRDEV